MYMSAKKQAKGKIIQFISEWVLNKTIYHMTKKGLVEKSPATIAIHDVNTLRQIS